MRYSNKYHKYTGYGQKAVDGELTYEEIKTPFKFDYVDTIINSTYSLFKGFDINVQSTRLITQERTGLKTKDRVWIDGSASIISSVIPKPSKNLAGGRFKTNNIDYLIILEE